ncbi:hypothetical protein [Actinoallomurus sp. CA-150999]|uniref:hypothetical protein n=1 Tax=Actinoallomurus sp. CA-150999 TaxID=3239887 RepID=UPI003D8BC2A1
MRTTSLSRTTTVTARTRRLIAALTALIATTLGVAIGAACMTPAHADTAQTPTTTKLTCQDFNGAGFINWDILVQLNPDGTAKSASQLGDAYLTGLQAVSVERTGQATINITNGGRSLSFHSDVLIQATVPLTTINFSGPAQGCSADFTFPNPPTTFTNLTFSS